MLYEKYGKYYDLIYSSVNYSSEIDERGALKSF